MVNVGVGNEGVVCANVGVRIEDIPRISEVDLDPAVGTDRSASQDRMLMPPGPIKDLNTLPKPRKPSSGRGRDGERVVRVDPRGTTCNCACGEKARLSLSNRVFNCPKCGLIIDGDLHGAFGTRRKIGWEAAEFTPVEMKPLLVARPASFVLETASPRQ